MFPMAVLVASTTCRGLLLQLLIVQKALLMTLMWKRLLQRLLQRRHRPRGRKHKGKHLFFVTTKMQSTKLCLNSAL